MITDALGSLRRDEDACAVRFERLYDYTPQELWAALTEPEQIRGWLADVSRFDAEPGGEVHLHFGDEPEGGGTRWRIREIEPERVLECEWHYPGEEPSILRFECHAREHGTLLVLDHRRLSADEAPGYAAGWHAHLEALAALHSSDDGAWYRRYRELRPVYEQAAAALAAS
jgi:uncharacterized protein YndB with AHSA1/START domain